MIFRCWQRVVAWYRSWVASQQNQKIDLKLLHTVTTRLKEFVDTSPERRWSLFMTWTWPDDLMDVMRVLRQTQPHVAPEIWDTPARRTFITFICMYYNVGYPQDLN